MACLVLRLPPVPASVPRSRHLVRDWLEDSATDLDDRTRDDVLVVVTELVTNGVLHDGGDAIGLWADTDPWALCVWVETADRARPSDARYREIDDPSERGRGLAIVEALSESVTTEVRDGRRQVSCRFLLHSLG